jgi:hypothetical protein
LQLQESSRKHAQEHFSLFDGGFVVRMSAQK